MMQPPVGVQPHGAFRDTQFCCFLSIKLKSDVQVSSLDLRNPSADADDVRILDFKGPQFSQDATENPVDVTSLRHILQTMLFVCFWCPEELVSFRTLYYTIMTNWQFLIKKDYFHTIMIYLYVIVTCYYFISTRNKMILFCYTDICHYKNDMSF